MHYSRLFLLVAALAALAACQPKGAATAAASRDTSPRSRPSTAAPISRDFYEFYIKGITGKNSAELSPQQRATALDNLIRAKLVGEEAVKEGLDKNGDTAYLLRALAPQRAAAGGVG